MFHACSALTRNNTLLALNQDSSQHSLPVRPHQLPRGFSSWHTYAEDTGLPRKAHSSYTLFGKPIHTMKKRFAIALKCVVGKEQAEIPSTKGIINIL